MPVPVPLEAAGLAVAGLETAAAGELAGALDGAEDAAPDDAPGVVAAPPLHAAKVAAARRIQIAALASVDARARAGRHRRDWRWERVTSMLDSPRVTDGMGRVPTACAFRANVHRALSCTPTLDQLVRHSRWVIPDLDTRPDQQILTRLRRGFAHSWVSIVASMKAGVSQLRQGADAMSMMNPRGLGPDFDLLEQQKEREHEHDREMAVMQVEAREQATGSGPRLSLVRRLLLRLGRNQAR